MSDSPESSTKPSEAEASESSSGLRSFLKRATRGPSTASNTSSEQAPPSKRKGSKLGNMFKSSRSSSVTEEGSSGSPGGATAAQKRRQQVYEAQKRHRNRKFEYEKNLEDEVTRLQQAEAQVSREKEALAVQNQAMRSLLAAQSIDVQLDAVGLDAPAIEWVDPSALLTAAVNVRFDEQMGHERTYVEFMDEDISMFATSDSEPPRSTTSTSSQHQQQHNRPPAVKGDSWAALDFILALEWPCQEHTGHSHLNPNPKPMSACQFSGLTGHALTTTSAVYARATPPPSLKSGQHSTASGPSYTSSTEPQQRQGLSQESQVGWQLSHSEIDKLVALSEKLELDNSEMTPAQAYAAVKDSVPSDQYLRPILAALKDPLGRVVYCGGLGAIIPADIFWQAYEDIIQSLQVDSSEQAQAAS